MRDSIFKINVGDILQESSRKDTITFREKFSTFLPQLVAPGISCIISIQGLDRRSVLLCIRDAQARILHVCDVCGKDFTDTSVLEEKELTCLFDEGVFEQEEDIITIHPKEKVIDIEQYLVESFFLAEGVVSLCNECEKKKEEKTNKKEEDMSQKLSF